MQVRSLLQALVLRLGLYSGIVAREPSAIALPSALLVDEALAQCTAVQQGNEEHRRDEGGDSRSRHDSRDLDAPGDDDDDSDDEGWPRRRPSRL